MSPDEEYAFLAEEIVKDLLNICSYDRGTAYVARTIAAIRKREIDRAIEWFSRTDMYVARSLVEYARSATNEENAALAQAVADINEGLAVRKAPVDSK